MAQQQQQKTSKYPQNHPDGLYEVKILGQALGESTAKKTPMLALKVEVQKLIKAKDSRPHNLQMGAHRTVKIYLTPGTADRVKKFLTEAGFYQKAKSLSQLNPNDPNHVSIVGHVFTATNSPEKSMTDGKIWDRFEPLISTKDPNAWMSKVGTANTAKVLQLDAIFGSVSTPAPAPAQKEKPKAQKPAAPDPDDDEPPFDVPAGEGDDQVDNRGSDDDFTW